MGSDGEIRAKLSWSELMDADLAARGHGGLSELVDEVSEVLDERSSRVEALVRRLSGRSREVAGETTCNVMVEVLLECPMMLREVFRRLDCVPVPCPSEREVAASDVAAGLARVQTDQAETMALLLGGVA